MRVRVLSCVALMLAQGACRSEETPGPAASAALPAAAAPASLLAELSLGNPKETWRSARHLGGTLAQVLPSSLPVLVATSLSLPPAAAGSLDETLPMVGVLLSRQDEQEPDVVVGMHVLSGQELVAALTLGDLARFRRVELGPRVVQLLSAPGAPQFNGVLGVSGNYLLLATSASALTDSGRFVAEVVSKRASVESGVTLKATESLVTGAMLRRLREVWQMRRAGLAARDRAERDAKGRAPDFAEPSVLLAGVDNTIEAWLAVLESSREFSVSLQPTADRLRAELTLTPSADGAAALLLRELTAGPATLLLRLPAATSVGLLIRGEAEPIANLAGSSGDFVAKLLGERRSAVQSKRLVNSLNELARSRRGATAIGFVKTPAPALLVACELADGQAFLKAVGDALSLLELPPVGAWLGGVLGRPSLESFKSTNAVRRARVRFHAMGHERRSPLPESVSLTWEARDGVGYVVISPDAGLGLSPFAEAKTLAASAWIGGALPAFTDGTALSLFADARLLAPGGPDEAPIWLSFGKKAERVALVLDVSATALPALAQLFALEREP